MDDRAYFGSADDGNIIGEGAPAKGRLLAVGVVLELSAVGKRTAQATELTFDVNQLHRSPELITMLALIAVLKLALIQLMRQRRSTLMKALLIRAGIVNTSVGRTGIHVLIYIPSRKKPSMELESCRVSNFYTRIHASSRTKIEIPTPNWSICKNYLVHFLAMPGRRASGRLPYELAQFIKELTDAGPVEGGDDTERFTKVGFGCPKIRDGSGADAEYVFEPRKKASRGSAYDDRHWEVDLYGASDTVYEGGVFRLVVSFPDDFPFKPVKVQFATKIWHPNINFSSGDICLDILKDAWAPSMTLVKVLQSILVLLHKPNPSDPYNTEAASQYKEWEDDKTKNTKYVDIVKSHMAKYSNKPAAAAATGATGGGYSDTEEVDADGDDW